MLPRTWSQVVREYQDLIEQRRKMMLIPVEVARQRLDQAFPPEVRERYRVTDPKRPEETGIGGFVKEEWGESLSPDEREFLVAMEDPENMVALVLSGRGCGKSWSDAKLALWSMIEYYDIFGPYFVGCLAGSQDQARITFDYAKNYSLSGRRYNRLLAREPIKIFLELVIGSCFLCYATSGARARGPHPDLLILDEVCEAEKRGHIETVRAARDSISSAKHGRIVETSTGHYPFGDFKVRWDNAKTLGFLTFGPWTTEPGKRTWMPLAKQVEQFDRAKQDPTINFDVEWLGEWGAVTGAVFNTQAVDFTITRYKLKRNKKFDAAMGVDWGFSPAPFSLMEVEQRPEGLHVLRAEDYYEATPDEVVNLIYRYYKDDKMEAVYVPVDRPDLIRMLEDRDVDVVEVNFSKDKEDRIGIVKHLIEKREEQKFRDETKQPPETVVRKIWHPLIRIHPQFKMLKSQLQGYMRDPKTGKPIKGNDHQIDCLLGVIKHFVPGGELYATEVEF